MNRHKSVADLISWQERSATEDFDGWPIDGDGTDSAIWATPPERRDSFDPLTPVVGNATPDYCTGLVQS